MRHRRAGVAGVGRLDRVHRQRADRVDARRVEIVSVRHGPGSLRFNQSRIAPAPPQGACEQADLARPTHKHRTVTATAAHVSQPSIFPLTRARSSRAASRSDCQSSPSPDTSARRGPPRSLSLQPSRPVVSCPRRRRQLRVVEGRREPAALVRAAAAAGRARGGSPARAVAPESSRAGWRLRPRASDNVASRPPRSSMSGPACCWISVRTGA